MTANIQLVKVLGYFLLLGAVVAGGFGLLFDSSSLNDNAAWGMLGLVVGLLVKEGSSIFSGSTTVVAQPPSNVTVTG